MLNILRKFDSTLNTASHSILDKSAALVVHVIRQKRHGKGYIGFGEN